MIKLVAIDLDNTLLEEDQSINKETLETISKCIEKGIHIVVCTGRSYEGAKQISNLFDGKLDIVCFNGCLISTNNQIIYDQTLNLDTCLDIIRYCKAKRLYVQFYDGKTIVNEKGFYEYLVDAERKYCDSRVVKNLEEEIIKFHSPKALINTLPVIVNTTFKEITKLLPNCYVTQSMPHLIEIMNKGVSKSNSLTILREYLGIKEKETMAIGDNLNDIDMVKWANTGVSVSNAIDELKTVSDYVCEKPRSLGVKEALKKYCL